MIDETETNNENTPKSLRASVNAPRPEDVGSFWRRMTSRGGGPAKPSKFLIQISPPSFPKRNLLRYPEEVSRYKDLTFQCESAELPGRTLATSDIQIGAVPVYKTPYGSTYSDMTLTFICTNDMYEKKVFDDWMNYIHSADNSFTFTYRKEYVTTINVFQYDEGSGGNPPSVTYGAQLIDAYPVGINQMSLAWGEDAVHRLGITFAYTYFRPIAGINSPVPIPFNPQSVIEGVRGGINSTLSGISRDIQNAAFGTVNGFINRTVNGAFTGLSTFLGGFTL
jgi:hypothetical protein